MNKVGRQRTRVAEKYGGGGREREGQFGGGDENGNRDERQDATRNAIVTSKSAFDYEGDAY